MENLILDLMREFNCDKAKATSLLNNILQDADIKETIKNKIKNDRKFVRNIFTVEVDGLHSLNHYKVYAEYEVRKEDENGEYWETEWDLIDEFDYDWDDIEKDGGLEQIKKDFKEEYNAVPA